MSRLAIPSAERAGDGRKDQPGAADLASAEALQVFVPLRAARVLGLCVSARALWGAATKVPNCPTKKQADSYERGRAVPHGKRLDRDLYDLGRKQIAPDGSPDTHGPPDRAGAGLPRKAGRWTAGRDDLQGGGALMLSFREGIGIGFAVVAGLVALGIVANWRSGP